MSAPRWLRCTRALGALLAVLALGAPARAQAPAPPAPAPPAPASPAPADDPRQAEAERLFEEGKVLLAREDWTAACALFDASARIVEAPPALVKIARCHAHAGHPARAIEVYERALALKPWAELDRLVRAELFEIQKKTPSIRITLVEPEEGATIRRNGRPLALEALRAPLWTDAGVEDHFLVEAPGYRSRSIDVKGLAEGEVRELRVALTRDAPPPAPPPPPTDARRPAGWALLGAGGLALGFGVGFGVEFLSLRGSVFDDCIATLADGRHVCPPSTSARRDAAVASRTRAVVLLGVGGALAAAGVVLLATAPRRGDAPRIALAAGPGGLDLGGTF